MPVRPYSGAALHGPVGHAVFAHTMLARWCTLAWCLPDGAGERHDGVNLEPLTSTFKLQLHHLVRPRIQGG
eukprot:363272-Chlamydomonas_euryale.AAC.7